MKHSSFIALVINYHIAIVMPNDKWQPATVSKAKLNSSGISNTFFNAPCDMVCAMTASRITWANLYCFDAGVCRILSFKTAPYERETPISDPVECMTKLDGCNYNGSYYSIGEHSDVDDNWPLCSLLWCQKGGMMTPYAPPQTFSDNCSAPYTKTAYGCFYANQTSKNFCDTRKFCLSTGGDLWTNSYLSSLALFNQALGPSGCWACFIGMYGIGPNMYWINGSVATSTYMAVKYSGSPSSSFVPEQCVGHTSASWANYFQANPCNSALRPTFCEKTTLQ